MNYWDYRNLVLSKTNGANIHDVSNSLITLKNWLEWKRSDVRDRIKVQTDLMESYVGVHTDYETLYLGEK